MAISEYIPTVEEMELQAVRSAAFYMETAIERINEQFGDGYAEDHPGLVQTFMVTAASGFNAALQAEGIKDIKDALNGIAVKLPNGA